MSFDVKRIALFSGGDCSSALLRFGFSTCSSHPDILEASRLHFYQKIACADSGLIALRESQFLGGEIFWVGDGDSLGEDPEVYFKNHFANVSKTIYKYSAEKDASDLALAVEKILSQQEADEPFVLEVFSAWGGRKDHERLMEEELVWLLSPRFSRVGGCVVVHPHLVIFSGKLAVEADVGQDFSLFSSCGMYPFAASISGAKYSGERQFLRPSHGLSNVFASSQVVISSQPGAILSLFVP